jgi:hypothetical protein
MLTLKGSDQVVRGYNAYKLSRRANITIKEAEDGLRILSEPDKRSDDQAFDGRRIKEVARDCWLILNGSEYQTQMALVLRRKYKAEKQRQYRARAKERAASK